MYLKIIAAMLNRGGRLQHHVRRRQGRRALATAWRTAPKRTRVGALVAAMELLTEYRTEYRSPIAIAT
jgi:hypothetical protein